MKLKSMNKAACMAAIAGMIALGFSLSLQAGKLERLDANFDYFGFEISTILAPPGVSIYKKTIFSKPDKKGHKVLFVSFFTTGDSHDGAATCFTALLDGAFMNAGNQGASRCARDAAGNPIPVPGWITLLKVPAGHVGTNCQDGFGGTGDCHDNAISYEWCATLPRKEADTTGGVHTVEIRMSSDGTGGRVFIEQAHFYVDEAKIKGSNRCVQTPKGDLAGDD